MLYAHTDRRGVITISDALNQAGLICIGHGEGWPFREAVSALARLAYDGETMLVPGIPEAENESQALEAAYRFRALLKTRGFNQ